MTVGMVVCTCEKDGGEEGRGRRGGQDVCVMRERTNVSSGSNVCGGEGACEYGREGGHVRGRGGGESKCVQWRECMQEG